MIYPIRYDLIITVERAVIAMGLIGIRWKYFIYVYQYTYTYIIAGTQAR